MFCLALVALLVLFFAQRRLIYPAPPAAGPVSAAGFERVGLPTDDGLTLTALYRPAHAGQPTVIFFHGNAASLSGSLVATEALAQAGYGLLLPEYRGYGGNPGAPDETGLVRDAAAAAAFLRQRDVPDGAIIAYGNSLGSGPATALATSRPLAGLALVSGYQSLPDLVAAKLAPLPLRALVRDRFDNFAKLQHSNVPVLVMHGDADQVIPVAQGRSLGSARADIVNREVREAGHELAYLPSTQHDIVTWLGSLPTGR